MTVIRISGRSNRWGGCPQWQTLTMVMLSLAWLAVPVASVRAQDADSKPTSLPRVLLIGDSISMGYHASVVAGLEGKAIVVRPKGNCSGTTKGVAKIKEWIEIDGGKFDVIHFNFGLHDLKAVAVAGDNKATNNPEDPRQADLETYEKQLSEIVKTLKGTGATLIFATTTPFPAGVKPHRDPEDAVRYNEVAKKIMKKNDVAIDDLYEFALPRLDEIQRAANVHFSKAGSKVLGAEVAKQLEKAMKKKR